MPQVRSPEVAFVFLGSIPRNGFVFPVGEMSVCTACVWALVSMHTALFGLIHQAALRRGSNRVGGLVKALALQIIIPSRT